MEKYELIMKSDSGSGSYNVLIQITDKGVTTNCSCPSSTLCKHIIRALSCEVNYLYDKNNISQSALLHQSLKGTDLELLSKEWIEAKEAMKKEKKLKEKIKKALLK